MTTEGQDPGFENWLEQQLQGTTGQQVGPHPQPAQAAYHHAFLSGGISMTGTSGALAALGGKAAAIATAAVLAAGVGGATAATQLTGSTNPDTWGKTVTAAVTTCKDKAAQENTHGIGQCVSAVASQHGQQERDQHSASGARENHASDARKEQPPASSERQDDHGKPTDKPGKPTSAPTGKATDEPHAGPPTGNPGGSHR